MVLVMRIGLEPLIKTQLDANHRKCEIRIQFKTLFKFALLICVFSVHLRTKIFLLAILLKKDLHIGTGFEIFQYPIVVASAIQTPHVFNLLHFTLIRDGFTFGDL